MADIPLLDWQQYETDLSGFSAQMGKVARETGFMLIKNHPVSGDLIARMFEMADAFFALPIEEKAKLDISTNRNNRGWAGVGTENLDDSQPDQKDAKQAFNIGLDLAADDPRILAGDPFRGVNLWPDVAGFRETGLAYFDAVLTMGQRLHRAIEMDLGLPQGYFESTLDQSLSTLRMLSYPAATGAEGEIGAGAHTDYGSVTLLMTDGAPGLQVKPVGGDWMDVPHIDGAFVVNIGDCLMRWSNDIYKSTPHRVLPPPRPRRSLAFFLDPNPDAVIKALPGTGDAKYPAITGADYLRSRLDATYIPKDLQED